MLRDRCPVCPVCLSYLSVTLLYRGQTVAWIKMPLGTEVGLGPGDIVLDGDPAPPRKRAQQPPPTFRSTSIAAKRSPILATAELLSTLFHRENIIHNKSPRKIQLHLTRVATLPCEISGQRIRFCAATDSRRS